MTCNLAEKFKKVVIENSILSKCMQRDVIEKIINIFDFSCEKKQYPRKIKNCIKLALKFYKQYNYEYYKIIVKGLKSKSIIIDDKIENSYTDPIQKKTYIKLRQNDGDLYILVHEFAHYIDRSLTPNIIPYKHNFLCEVFSFYMERQLERYLLNKKNFYEELISTRNNNRIYFASKIINDLKTQLYYEDLFKSQGEIAEEQINIEDAKRLLKYKVSNIVNYLLRYPLGNILSEYIINNNLLMQDYDICEVCFQLDWKKILDDYIRAKTKTLK